MKPYLVLSMCVWLGCVSSQGIAQLSVNQGWGERSGLAVASSQTVSVAASKLRVFATLESVAEEPRAAVAQLKADKKALLDAVMAIGLPETAVAFTPTRILEWEQEAAIPLSYASDTQALKLTADTDRHTALAHVAIDVPLETVDADELAVLPYDICQRLRGHTIFESREMFVLYVGELTPNQMRDAQKRAFDEAFAEAKSVARLSKRSLGKLVALTPETEGRWRYRSGLTGKEARFNPLANFTPAENELLGQEVGSLSRTFTIELRFDIETADDGSSR